MQIMPIATKPNSKGVVSITHDSSAEYKSVIPVKRCLYWYNNKKGAFVLQCDHCERRYQYRAPKTVTVLDNPKCPTCNTKATYILDVLTVVDNSSKVFDDEEYIRLLMYEYSMAVNKFSYEPYVHKKTRKIVIRKEDKRIFLLFKGGNSKKWDIMGFSLHSFRKFGYPLVSRDTAEELSRLIKRYFGVSVPNKVINDRNDVVEYLYAIYRPSYVTMCSISNKLFHRFIDDVNNLGDVEGENPRELVMNLYGVKLNKSAFNLLRGISGIEYVGVFNVILEYFKHFGDLFTYYFEDHYSLYLRVEEVSMICKYFIENSPSKKVAIKRLISVYDTTTLKDTIIMMKDLNININITKMKESEIKREHDRLSKIHNEYKKDIDESKYVKIKNRLNMYTITVNGYTIRPPKNIAEIYEVGNILGNCLSSYVDDIVDRNTEVYFMFKNDEPVAAIEYDGRIRQASGKYNEDLEDEPTEVVRQWEKRRCL